MTSRVVPLVFLMACAPADAPQAGAEPPAPVAYADDLLPLGTEKSAELLETRAYDDGLVLFCTGTSGLHVVDATNPTAPELLAIKLASPSAYPYPRCQHLARAGDLAYVTSRGDELQPASFVAAFDLSVDPPVEVAVRVDSSLSFEGLAIVDDTAWVAAHGAGLVGLDATTLEPELTLGGFTNAWAVAAQDDRLLVADGEGGLAVVVPPEAPTSVALDGVAKDVALHAASNTAYVATGAAGIAVVSLDEPPSLVRIIDTPGSAQAVAVEDGRLWVADWQDGRVFLLEDPRDPSPAGSEASRGPVLGVAARGDLGMFGTWFGLDLVKHDPAAAPPDLRLGSSRIDLGSLPTNTPAAAAIIVHNDGRAPLSIREAQLGPPLTLVGELPTVEPGGAAAIEVRFTPTDATPLSATVTFVTDDPDEPEAKVTVEANRPGLGPGDAPPAVEVELLDGSWWTLADSPGQVTLLAYFATF